jgi:hypothetical protein
MAQGCDFAYGSGITTQQLKAAGITFVCRYLSGGGNPKDISKAELANYKAAGISVVLNWETFGTMPGRAQGVADAKRAASQASSLGAGNAAIYFSADFNPNGNTSGILGYMNGVASVLGHERTGLYAGYQGIQAYFNAGIGKYGWQTYAWSSGHWDNRAQLQQYQNNVYIRPATVDRDRSTTSDFGAVSGTGGGPPPVNPPAKPPVIQPDVWSGPAVTAIERAGLKVDIKIIR